MLDTLREQGFQVQFVSHASAILSQDFPDAIAEIGNVLSGFRIPVTEIVGSGGGETKGTQRMRKAFAEAGWRKKHYEIRKIINGKEKEATSHEVDHVKRFTAGEIALEIEWNNKDPFFDRDLENYKRLHAEGAISLGVIVTRGASLHGEMGGFVQRFAEENEINAFADLDRLGIELTRPKRAAIQRMIGKKKDPLPFPEAWRRNFVSNKYGEATTHWRKLQDRIARGVGNPCPLMLIGLPASVITFTHDTGAVAAEIARAAIENADEPTET